MATYSDTLRQNVTSGPPIVGAIVQAVQGTTIISSSATNDLGAFTITAPIGVYTIQYIVNGTIRRQDYNVSIGEPVTAIARAYVNLTDYGAVFDGRDITAAILAAQADARAAGIREYRFAQGTFRWSQELVWQTGEKIVGIGANVTIGYKTFDGWGMTFGDWGNLANGFYGGGAEGLTLYHDYGTGQFPPNTSGGMTNPTTTGGIIRTWLPNEATFGNLWLLGGKAILSIFGGAGARFRSIRLHGVYDPTVGVLQETTACVLVDGSTSAIPTTHEFVGCSAGGNISAVRDIPWPGSHTSSDAVANIGALNVLDLRAGEGINWNGGYIGAGAVYGVRFKPNASGILRNISIRDAFIDAHGYAAFSFDNSNAVSPQAITISPNGANGQLNGLMGITDKDSDLSNWSVIDLIVEGEWENYVGPVFDLKRMARTRINACAKNWNARAYYNTGAVHYDACLIVAETNNIISYSGVIGGGPAGDGSGSPAHDAYAIRYTSSGNPAKVTLGTIALGTGTTLSTGL